MEKINEFIKAAALFFLGVFMLAAVLVRHLG